MTATPPAPFTLPAPVGAVLARLPAYPGSLLLVTAINLALAKQLPDDVKALLHGKRISIRVRDARLGFDFTWNGQRFAPSQPYAEADLTISANAQDFLLLAQPGHPVLQPPPGHGGRHRAGPGGEKRPGCTGAARA